MRKHCYVRQSKPTNHSAFHVDSAAWVNQISLAQIACAVFPFLMCCQGSLRLEKIQVTLGLSLRCNLRLVLKLSNVWVGDRGHGCDIYTCSCLPPGKMISRQLVQCQATFVHLPKKKKKKKILWIFNRRIQGALGPLPPCPQDFFPCSKLP